MSKVPVYESVESVDTLRYLLSKEVEMVLNVFVGKVLF